MSAEPTKLYYSISEVAELTGVKPHVLRYWETEFPSLRPRKGRAGSRRYRRRDIDEVEAIRSLLYDRGFKIAGARKHLLERRQGSEPAAQRPAQLAIAFERLELRDQVAFLRQELGEIRALLAELRPGGE